VSFPVEHAAAPTQKQQLTHHIRMFPFHFLCRIASPVSDSSKEIAALGVLVSVAGFFSFGQNLIVDGFVTLPSISLPSLLPMPEGDGGVDYEAIMSMKDSATDTVVVE
jgi:hypothetical protein